MGSCSPPRPLSLVPIPTWKPFIRVQHYVIYTGPAERVVLAGLVFFKVKMEVHFYKKQAQ